MSMYFAERASLGTELNRRAAERENGSREAAVTFRIQSAGVGRNRHNDVLHFPAPFIEEPSMVQGSGVVKNPSPNNWWDPEGTAGVWSWARNEKGLYIGAKVWTAVTMVERVSGADDVSEGVKVLHWLRFHGIAIKDLGREALDTSLTVVPHEVML
jgi:hypothetical protein